MEFISKFLSGAFKVLTLPFRLAFTMIKIVLFVIILLIIIKLLSAIFRGVRRAKEKKDFRDNLRMMQEQQMQMQAMHNFS